MTVFKGFLETIARPVSDVVHGFVCGAIAGATVVILAVSIIRVMWLP